MMADSLNTEDAHFWLFHRRKIRAQIWRWIYIREYNLIVRV